MMFDNIFIYPSESFLSRNIAMKALTNLKIQTFLSSSYMLKLLNHAIVNYI